MKKIYKLYIDELGMSHPDSYEKSPYYILLGSIIDEQKQKELENHANHIKFKYWGRTDIIFHSADIARSTKEFATFAHDEARKTEFITDLLTLLQSAPVTITAAIVDKAKAHQSSWTEQTVIRRSAESVLFNFLAFTYTKLPCKGKIIIEASNIDRDTQYLTAFNRLLSPSLKEKYPIFDGVRDHLTSITFVTKQNHDIESQIADLLAYGIRCIQEVKETEKRFEKKSYEYKIMRIAETKLIKMAPSMGEDKRQYFALIDPMFITPKKVSKPKEKRG